MSSNEGEINIDTTNTMSVKSSKSNELLDQLAAARQRFLEERRGKIAEIKSTTPDKEPFDVNTFGTMYNLRGMDGQLRVTPEIVEELEADYYLSNPEIASLKDFASHKTHLDEVSEA